jgi:hypothetical protein
MTTDSLPITVLIPEGPIVLIEVYDQHSALKLAIVERFGVSPRTPEWDQRLMISGPRCLARP